MNIKDILSKCDHTLLKPTATLSEIKALCDEGIEYGVASVCIPPAYVKEAREYVGDRLRICTVVGFPNGYSASVTKSFEALEAIRLGADEIDTVINLGDLKDGRYEKILAELRALRKGCKEKILKVIIETCLLTDEEIVKMCEIVTGSGADYIKTSTGFSSGGATVHTVRLMRENVGRDVKVKAAGGISSFEDAEALIEAGADRLGTSRLVPLARELESKEKGLI